MNVKKEPLRLIIPAIFTIGGIFGFFYELLFYRLDLGCFVKRGITYGPWIPIYGFGALLIVLATERLRRQPFLVFLAGMAVCGGLEFATGYILLHVFHTRLWDYGAEIWNWMNLGGYICLRSVLFFGVSALLLQYVIHPLLGRAFRELPEPKRTAAALVPFALFAADIVISLIRWRLG